jgi:hypothetical protein
LGAKSFIITLIFHIINLINEKKYHIKNILTNRNRISHLNPFFDGLNRNLGENKLRHMVSDRGENCCEKLWLFNSQTMEIWNATRKNKFFPLILLNHLHVLQSGNYNSNQFPEIAASIVKFERGDVINLGAPNAGAHPDLVTLGFGFRYRSLYPCFPLDFGFAYELPLTSKENGLMSNRLSWDLIYRF